MAAQPRRPRRRAGASAPERPEVLADWGRREMSKHQSRVMLEAAHAIANYSARHWIDQIDVPTSVIVTERDTAVSPQAQLKMAMAIPGRTSTASPAAT
jgi:hypothetical protein